MKTYFTRTFRNTEFLQDMEVAEDPVYVDLNVVNIASLKATASWLKKAGKGQWSISKDGAVQRLM